MVRRVTSKKAATCSLSSTTLPLNSIPFNPMLYWISATAKELLRMFCRSIAETVKSFAMKVLPYTVLKRIWLCFSFCMLWALKVCTALALRWTTPRILSFRDKLGWENKRNVRFIIWVPVVWSGLGPWKQMDFPRRMDFWPEYRQEGLVGVPIEF